MLHNSLRAAEGWPSFARPKRVLCRACVRSVIVALSVAMLSAAIPAWARQDVKKDAAPPVLTEDNEVRIGRENAEAFDKSTKLVTDAAMVERVNRIGQEIAAVADKISIPANWGSSQVKQFKYSFKIVDDKDVNAFSLPGGFIYVNKGLINYVRSDDELAGVLGHEITHAAHHHMVKLLHEQKKLENVLTPVALAAILASAVGRNAGSGASNVLLMSNLIVVAKMNTFGIEAEKDADHGGLMLLTHTKYNPVGLYSFMLRLAADEVSKAHGDMGIFLTHPPGVERAQAAKALLDELNIPILMSAVDPTLRVSVTMSKDKDTGVDLAELRWRDILLCRVAAEQDQTAQDRGLRIAQRLTGFLDLRLQPFEVRLSADNSRVMARGFAVLTDADAAAQKRPIGDLAHDLAGAISQINQKEQFENVTVAQPGSGK